MTKKTLPNFELELNLSKEFDLIVGIDEVGRGAIAGPLTLCALAIKKSFYENPIFFKNLKVKDSKLLSEVHREKIFEQSIETIFFKKTVMISNKTIDKIGMSLSFKKALEKIEMFYRKVFPSKKILFLIDYYFYKPKYENIFCRPLKNGDRLSFSIALASIHAKVERDNLMKKLHKKLPLYNWHKNKGYGTEEHLSLIKKHGVSKYHRKSFLKNWL